MAATGSGLPTLLLSLSCNKTSIQMVSYNYNSHVITVYVLNQNSAIKASKHSRFTHASQNEVKRNERRKEKKREGKEKKEMGGIEQCIASKSYVPVIFFSVFSSLFFFFFCRIYRKPEKSSRREKILITIEEAPVKTRPKSPTGEQCALSAAKMAILYFVYYAAFETPSHLYRIDNNYKIFDRRRWKQSAFDYIRRRKFSTLLSIFFSPIFDD